MWWNLNAIWLFSKLVFLHSIVSHLPKQPSFIITHREEEQGCRGRGRGEFHRGAGNIRHDDLSQMWLFLHIDRPWDESYLACKAFRQITHPPPSGSGSIQSVDAADSRILPRSRAVRHPSGRQAIQFRGSSAVHQHRAGHVHFRVSAVFRLQPRASHKISERGGTIWNMGEDGRVDNVPGLVPPNKEIAGPRLVEVRDGTVQVV